MNSIVSISKGGGAFSGCFGGNSLYRYLLYPTPWRSLRVDQNKIPRTLYRVKFPRGSIPLHHSMIRDRQPFENHRQSGRSEPESRIGITAKTTNFGGMSGVGFAGVPGRFGISFFILLVLHGSQRLLGKFSEPNLDSRPSGGVRIPRGVDRKTR